MNYRHAFHAGNFADVFKHALLTRMLIYQIRKPAPLRFIDTHAGIGSYDLAGPEASRTGEWRFGIGRLDPAALPPGVAALLEPYLASVGPRDPEGRPSLYPGSPAIAQALLRPADRLSLNEAHPEDVETLRLTAGRDRRVTVTALDGSVALRAALPPPERRGLVLIDPPFEERDEFARMLAALTEAHRKWPTGTCALWYPIKLPAEVAAFAEALAATGIRRILQLHLVVGRVGTEAGPLGGCGLVVVNPPFGFAAEAAQILPALATALGRGGAGSWSQRLLVGE